MNRTEWTARRRGARVIAARRRGDSNSRIAAAEGITVERLRHVLNQARAREALELARASRLIRLVVTMIRESRKEGPSHDHAEV